MRRYSGQSIEVTCGVKIGILVVVDGASADDQMPADNVDVSLVIEEQVIIHELHNCLRYTFEVVQKIFLNIGAENYSKVHGLKNRLLR
uniref:TCTP domain-containing protein n=1 Tax=Salmo trutta TaxID=8032 RepID=A0A674C4T0_SALTR